MSGDHTTYKYQLEPYNGKNRYSCPGCGKKKTFTRYVDQVSGAYINEAVGKCDRVQKCGYHYPPSEFFKDHPSAQSAWIPNQTKTRPSTRSKQGMVKSKRQMATTQTSGSTEPIYLPYEVFEGSLSAYHQNRLVDFLLQFFPVEEVKAVISDYRVGTSSFWPGATVFWLISAGHKVGGGQVVQFEAETGKTVKVNVQGEKKRRTNWVHKALINRYRQKGQTIPGWLKRYDEEAPKIPFLFGEHFLADADFNQVIAVTEAPKTALVGKLLWPEMLWTACLSLSNLTQERCRVLAGRKVIFFPDKGGYDAWKQKVQGIEFLENAEVSYMLEEMEALDDNDDLVDWFLKVHLPSISNTTHEHPVCEHTDEAKPQEPATKQPWWMPEGWHVDEQGRLLNEMDYPAHMDRHLMHNDKFKIRALMIHDNPAIEKMVERLGLEIIQ